MRNVVFLMLVAISCPSFAAMDKSKTIYKCMKNKKVVYTDEPCVGGTEPEIVPTQGLDKDSGRSLKGQDIQTIERREIWVDNFMKPAFGVNREAYKVMTERQKLTPREREECYKLDSTLLKAKEAVKTAIDKATKEQTELNLFETRKRFKILKC